MTDQLCAAIPTKITSLLPLITEQLADLSIDPFDLHITAPATADPTVRIVFRTRTDLERYAAQDRAKVEEVTKSHLKHVEYSALYERPGRRVLLTHHCFDHCTDRTAA